MIASMVSIYTFPSELGFMAIAWRDDRLVRLTFGHPSAAAAIASLAEDGIEGTAAPSLSGWLEDLVARLQSYAAGNDERFDDVPLDLSHLSAFQSRVVRHCRQISRGRVRTYADLADAAGSTGAARAVGNVMAHNRYPIIVPCHRVVGSAGSLGGFSARDGINMKRRMLEMEGAALKAPRKSRNTRNHALLARA